MQPFSSNSQIGVAMSQCKHSFGEYFRYLFITHAGYYRVSAWRTVNSMLMMQLFRVCPSTCLFD